MTIRPVMVGVLVLLAAGCERARSTKVSGYSAAESRGAPTAAPAAMPAAMPAASADREGDASAGVPFRAGSAAADSASITPRPQGGTMAIDSVAASMIIRTGQASIRIDSLDVGLAAVRQLARRVGGYVANTQVQTGPDQTHSAVLELKIPATRFDEALGGLRGIGTLESVNVTAEDVGEEYVDVNARVANARRLEARLVELLASRTGKLSDVLQVERELARVREEIERYEGRLRYLRTRAAISTLAVTIHEPLPVVGDRGSGSELAESFRQAWRNFVSFVAGFIASLGTLIPLALVVAGIGFGIARTARKFRTASPAGPRPPSPVDKPLSAEG